MCLKSFISKTNVTHTNTFIINQLESQVTINLPSIRCLKLLYSFSLCRTEKKNFETSLFSRNAECQLSGIATPA